MKNILTLFYSKAFNKIKNPNQPSPYIIRLRFRWFGLFDFGGVRVSGAEPPQYIFVNGIAGIVIEKRQK